MAAVVCDCLSDSLVSDDAASRISSSFNQLVAHAIRVRPTNSINNFRA
jgi:hypothetical protein